jgi:hypothetical protein
MAIDPATSVTTDHGFSQIDTPADACASAIDPKQRAQRPEPTAPRPPQQPPTDPHGQYDRKPR